VIALLETLVKQTAPTRYGRRGIAGGIDEHRTFRPQAVCGATAGSDWPPLMNGGVQFNCS
jgi:hypothetical protein